MITWLFSSLETWRNSRQRIVKRHPWRLLEQHWPPWPRVGGRWGSRYQGDVWDVLYTMVYLNLWSICLGKWWISGFKGKLFLDPDLHEAESAVICHSSLALNVGHVSRNSCTSCNRTYLTDCFMFLPDSVITQIAMFSDEDVEPQLGMWAFQTSDPWLVILVIATWQALGNVKPTRVRQFCCERESEGGCGACCER